jgi:hypothetical protein
MYHPDLDICRGLHDRRQARAHQQRRLQRAQSRTLVWPVRSLQLGSQGSSGRRVAYRWCASGMTYQEDLLIFRSEPCLGWNNIRPYVTDVGIGELTPNPSGGFFSPERHVQTSDRRGRIFVQRICAPGHLLGDIIILLVYLFHERYPIGTLGIYLSTIVGSLFSCTCFTGSTARTAQTCYFRSWRLYCQPRLCSRRD